MNIDLMGRIGGAHLDLVGLGRRYEMVRECKKRVSYRGSFAERLAIVFYRPKLAGRREPDFIEIGQLLKLGQKSVADFRRKVVLEKRKLGKQAVRV